MTKFVRYSQANCWLMVFFVACVSSMAAQGHAQTESTKLAEKTGAKETKTASLDESDWAQWRGPRRDGSIKDGNWPSALGEDILKKVWSNSLGPSYSGPLVVGDRVYVTEKDGGLELVKAFDRESGKEVWTSKWEGAMNVPFFAASNGNWIRSTPTYDDGKIFVAGMRDVVVCLNADDGKIIWTKDFPKELGTPLPDFGFVCSPLVDGKFVYVQAGGGFIKLEKDSGKMVWQSLNDGGGMYGSAFSSPVIAEVAGKRQAIVLTRASMCGVDVETGKKLWEQKVKAFRGMNILTPTVIGDDIFTSTYGGTTQMMTVTSGASGFEIKPKWALPAQGYMSSPVVVDGHAYIHLKNNRFACFDLENGVEKWRSKPYGKYASMVASGDKILALDQRGGLLLIRANPNEFDLIDTRRVGNDSWAHVAVSGNDVVVRNLDEVVLFKWGK
ncbi:MAG: PQQ-binding-like beta-propeller repeat protein [Mariniblastus sp.]